MDRNKVIIVHQIIMKIIVRTLFRHVFKTHADKLCFVSIYKSTRCLRAMPNAELRPTNQQINKSTNQQINKSTISLQLSEISSQLKAHGSLLKHPQQLNKSTIATIFKSPNFQIFKLNSVFKNLNILFRHNQVGKLTFESSSFY